MSDTVQPAEMLSLAQEIDRTIQAEPQHYEKLLSRSSAILGDIASIHQGLYSQIGDLSAKLIAVQGELTAARYLSDNLQSRLKDCHARITDVDHIAQQLIALEPSWVRLGNNILDRLR